MHGERAKVTPHQKTFHVNVKRILHQNASVCVNTSVQMYVHMQACMQIAETSRGAITLNSPTRQRQRCAGLSRQAGSKRHRRGVQRVQQHVERLCGIVHAARVELPVHGGQHPPQGVGRHHLHIPAPAVLSVGQGSARSPSPLRPNLTSLTDGMAKWTGFLMVKKPSDRKFSQAEPEK